MQHLFEENWFFSFEVNIEIVRDRKKFSEWISNGLKSIL